MKNKLAIWIQKNDRQVWCEYGLLVLLILGPLLLPGYILTLDLVFVPHLAWPHELTNTYPLDVVLWLINHLLPGDVLEKCVLWGGIVLAGVGMHLFVKEQMDKHSTIRWIAPYFAGIFYVINPFTYSRFMAGQWMVLLGYALLPFFILALVRWLQYPTRRSAVIAGLWAFGTVSVSIHQSVILPVVAVAAIIAYRAGKRFSRSFALQCGLFVGVPLLLGSFWLIPALMGQSGVMQSVTSFNHTHFEAFATNGGGLGAFGEVLRLQGFWADAQQLYVLPQQRIPLWGLLWIILWIIIATGFVLLQRIDKRLSGFAAALFVTGLVGAATPLVEWVGGILPFFQGIREPHKFAMLVVWVFALCGAFGVTVLQRWFERRQGVAVGRVVAFGSILLLFAVTPTMVWGFSGQLTPRQYPNDWTDMNEYMKEHLPVSEVLFVPWHQYANYSFSGRIVANPAAKYFENLMIISDEPEFRGVPPTRPDDKKRVLSAALRKKDVAAIRSVGVKYVLIAKEQEYEAYDWMKIGATIEKKTDTLLLLNIGEKNE